ncbi:PREDICTED: coiled-coil domain-containing protein 103-like [Priapulus caudatus]|uniref:Coiled-coil domain-containing protein 103-like n=1 Tax=Priapulus caudatus TaxID=37621 RepID=A0ABM1EF94_PRICU|nr:PREDICTED: coiled-coil domain-containing protein 103-like [Priapulus caudatus]
MASLDDEPLDLKKLGKELKGALAADEEYWLRNDAKMRAMQQRVGSYEEFRDIVNAAHLRPLAKKDKVPERRLQPWNSLACAKPFATFDQRAAAAEETQSQSPTKSQQLPKNGHEFLRDWRRAKDAEGRFDLLRACGGERLRRFFDAEFVFGLLGDVLPVARETMARDPSEFAAVCDVLLGVARTKGFSLALELLSAAEQEARRETMELLACRAAADGGAECSELLASVREQYGDVPATSEERET